MALKILSIIALVVIGTSAWVVIDYFCRGKSAAAKDAAQTLALWIAVAVTATYAATVRHPIVYIPIAVLAVAVVIRLLTRKPHDLHETEDFSDSDCHTASLLGQPIDAFRDRGA